MRALPIPAALAAFVAAAPAFAAAQHVEGAVKAFDGKAMTLTLDNGVTYRLPAGFKDPGIKAGEKVAVSWEMKNGQHAVDTVTIVK